MGIALVALLFAQVADPIEVWIDDLASELPQVRAHAAERLREAGSVAASALEARQRLPGGIVDPEARSRAHEILRILRTPRAILRAPPLVDARRKQVVVHLVIRNPRPEPVRIEPIYVRRGRGFVPNSRWSIKVPGRLAAIPASRAELRRALTIPAHGDAVYPIPVATRLKGRSGFSIHVRYRGADFELSAKTNVRVGRESLENFRRRAFSRNAAQRSEAVLFIRYELRSKRADRLFLRTLGLAARSPYRDMRIGVARAIGDTGQFGQREQIEVLCGLAEDRDLKVASTAFTALARVCPPRTTVSAVYRLAAKSFARPGDARSNHMMSVIRGWTRRDRRAFLAGVLGSSRATVVHKEVAAILRRDGVPVEPGSNGLVPRSQITNLRR